MSSLLDKIHLNSVHRFNPIVAGGVSVHQLDGALEYVDKAFKLSAQSFPPKLKYDGYQKCTVQDEFQYLSQRKSTNHSLEIAQSDTYMVNFNFSWDGVPLPPKPIFMPFVGKGGLLYLRGKRFVVHPVLADETISVAKEDIFVPFLSAKVTFKRKQYWFKLDGMQRTEYLVYSTIHNHNVNDQPRRNLRANLSVKCDHTMAHYLFCKYGVAGTFRKYFNTEIFVTDGAVDRTVFPEETYVVASSSQIQPRSVRMKNYPASNVKIAMERSKLNNGTLGLLSGLFYVLDHYPDRFSQETLDGTEDEIRLWRVMLGHAIFRNRDNEGELYNKVCDHFDSLDQYVDDMTREGLEAQGYPVNDLYDLMALLIFDFTEILMKTNPASMFGKMLAVNRYVLSDIIRGMSIFKYKITSIKNKELSYQDINKYLNKYLKPEIISNGLKKHNEIVSAQSPGDNIMFSYTSKVILQENASGTTGRKAVTSFKDPSKLLDVSIAVAGSILALPKSEPTGRTVLNPYLPLDRTYKIKQPENMKPLLNYIQERIKQV